MANRIYVAKTHTAVRRMGEAKINESMFIPTPNSLHKGVLSPPSHETSLGTQAAGKPGHLVQRNHRHFLSPILAF